CRKPGVAMHRRAAARLDLDMGRSWCVGDRLADIIPAARIGAQGALVLTGEGPGWERQAVDAGAVAIADLTALADALACPLVATRVFPSSLWAVRCPPLDLHRHSNPRGATTMSEDRHRISQEDAAQLVSRWRKDNPGPIHSVSYDRVAIDRILAQKGCEG